MDEASTSRLEAISTRWTLLRRAHSSTSFSSAESRNALVLRYLPAVRRYVASMVHDDQEAEDLAQDLAVRMLAGDFAGADPTRGRFRDFLKVAIRNMVRNYWSRKKRRRTVDYDPAEAPAQTEHQQEQAWLAQWRASVLELVWQAFRQKERRQPGSVACQLLELRKLYPEDTSEQLAARLSEKIGKPIRADALRQKLRRARLQFVDCLITELSNGIKDPTPEKIEEELVALGLIDLVRELLPADWKRLK